ncbi:MAG: helix-turn-helix transcriptional regulator [Candidatus Heimdallarchaeota archaeon]|nr:helix-turn-helix transcriptional regulator [Candidatus Heimdallarchaeota archaeon]
MGKLKILDLLSRELELNVTAISKKTKLNHTRVKVHLEDLRKLEIIKEKRFGRIKIYLINDEFDIGYKLKKFLQEWDLNNRIDRERM